MKDEQAIRRALSHFDEIASVNRHPTEQVMLAAIRDLLHWALDEPNSFDPVLAELDAVDKAQPVN